MNDQQQSRWWPTRRDVLWVMGTVVVLGLVISLLGGYLRGWPWTGIVEDNKFPQRTLWDWLKLLIVPAVLAAGGVWFNRQQQKNQSRVEERRSQYEALEAYIGRIGEMVTKEGLRSSRSVTDDLRELQEDTGQINPQHTASDDLRVLARAQTLTLLTRLEPDQKRSVLQYLYEAALIHRQNPIIDLKGANLRSARLAHIELATRVPVPKNKSHSDAPLDPLEEEMRTTHSADLGEADLSDADMEGADLAGAYLVRANLSGSDLSGADLTGADLSVAILSGAKLMGADLTDADLSFAEGFTNEALDQHAKSLKGATMPDTQKYEDWLKDKEGSGQDGENSNPT